MSLNLPKPPQKYDTNDQAQMRALLEKADALNQKKSIGYLNSLLLTLLTVDNNIIQRVSGAVASVSPASMLKTVLTTAGDWLYNDSGTVVRKTTAQAAAILATVQNTLPFPPGHINITIANNASDATNDIDISSGTARDSTNADNIVLASAITKRLDASWAVGTNNGGLDTGSIADTTYHVWLIKRTDTGVVDVLFSTSASAPTMPTSYTLKRRIGSIIRSGSTILPFKQLGDEFILDVTIQDANDNNPGTSVVTKVLTVPNGIVVDALVNVFIQDATASTNTFLLITSTDQTDTTPSLTNFHLYTPNVAGAKVLIGISRRTKTDTSRQIRYRISGSDTDRSVLINTDGWVDRRGQ